MKKNILPQVPKSVILTIVLYLVVSVILWKILPNKEFGLNMISEVLGIFVTVCAIETVISYEKRKKWLIIENKVRKLISEEIDSIRIDFNGIVKIYPIISSSKELSNEEIFYESRKLEMKELVRLADSDIKEIRERINQEFLDNISEKLFFTRNENLNWIEVKYSKYLEPEELLFIIDLELLMLSLGMNMKILRKMRKEVKKTGNTSTNSFFENSYEERITNRIHETLKIIKKMIKIGILQKSQKF